MNESRSRAVELQHGPVTTITLNRPKVRNAIDDTMRGELIEELDRLASDDSVRALVITGAGVAFCAGGDIRGMRDRMAAPAGSVAFRGWSRQQRTHRLMEALHGFPKLTIAAVNGAATGLGCDLALCCDFVLASRAASFAMTYVLRGLIPDGGGLYFLPRRVGLARAKELIFSGRTVAPEDALAMGMVDRIAAPEDLVSEATAWAAQLSSGSLPALALSKAILNQTFELTAERIFALGSQAQAICYTTDEHRAAVDAFLDKASRK